MNKLGIVFIIVVVGVCLNLLVDSYLLCDFKVCEAKQGRTLVGDSDGGEPQFEAIAFGFKIYTIRNHEYLCKEGTGITHLASCKKCKSERRGE